ncbi:MAG: nitrile hydratase subunit beta, partial [Arenicellales bacterium]
MNGVHDMGGMHGFGPVRPEIDEPVFHATWEARVLAMVLAMGAFRKWNIDARRHGRERIPPVRYLASSYYERWLAGLETLMVEHGLVTERELRTGVAEGEKGRPAVTADEVVPILETGGPCSRDEGKRAGFSVGQPVRARNIHPEAHTRLPRYARGKRGVILRDHGIYVFADSNAHFRGEQPQHLYNVRFEA